MRLAYFGSASLALVSLASVAPAQSALSARTDSTPTLPAWIDLKRDHRPLDIVFALNGTAEGADEKTRAAVMKSVGATSGRVLMKGRIFELTLPDATRLREALVQLNADPRVKYAQPSFVYQVDGTTPNDPSFGAQWGWNQANDADIDAPEAWDVATDASSVVVAIIDTGVEYTHSDLAANMWHNPGEIAGNGLDDDGNGWVDDIYGIDAVNGDADPLDDHFHGTHVAGTIGAVGNNGIGVTGACWKARIMAIKCFDASGSGDTADIIVGLDYATTKGAQLSNNSWGGYGTDQALYDAIDAAGDDHHLFVAAAGNSGINIEGQNWLPGGYDLANVLCVAATDSNDGRAWFSNFGPVSVDLGAPGDTIYSTFLGNSYNYLSGTSMATPHVTGVATMVFAKSQSSDDQAVKQWLLDGADPIASMNGITVTGGRLNFRGALDQIPTLPASGFLFSTKAAATVGAVSWDRDDIVHLDPATGIFTLIFDGSDLIAGQPNLDAIAKLADGSLLLSWDRTVTIPGLTGGPNGTSVDREDIVRFFPWKYGDTTDGKFEFYFDGSDVGFDTADEDIDALAVDASGNLLISTVGAFSITGGLTGRNEDVLLFVPTSLGANTAGSATLFLNGRVRKVQLGKRTENVDAIDFDDATQTLTLSTTGDFGVPVQLFGQNDDLLAFVGTAWGANTDGSFSLAFDGLGYGLDPHDIDALEILP